MKNLPKVLDMDINSYRVKILTADGKVLALGYEYYAGTFGGVIGKGERIASFKTVANVPNPDTDQHNEKLWMNFDYTGIADGGATLTISSSGNRNSIHAEAYGIK